MKKFFHETNNILEYAWINRMRLLPGAVLAVCRVLVLAPYPWMYKIIVDNYIKTRNAEGIERFAAIILGLLAIHLFFSVMGAKYLARGIQGMMVRLRSRIFDKFQFLSFGYLDQKKSGSLLSKYAFDTQKIEAALMVFMNQILPDSVYSLCVLSLMMFLHWQLAVILMMVIPVYGFMRFYFFAKIKRQNEEARLAQERLTGTAGEYITALRLVRSLGEERQATDHVGETSRDLAQSKIELSKVSMMMGSFVYSAGQAFSLLVIAGGALLMLKGSISIGTLFAFMTAMPIILMPINLLSMGSDQYFNGQAGFNSIKELLDAPYVEDWRGTRRFDPLRGEIRLENVTFHYPNAEKHAIRDLTLELKPGESVAFVGQSGAGKSTLVNLMLGLYKPSSGVVTVDGHAQAEIDMRWFRKQTAVVMQDNLLLTGTIGDNIRFARPGASDAEVAAAARLANAEEFIAKLPKGYHTGVGERGVTLSGGQRQRISIARAILRDPRVLILDEATSALDYQSERLVQEALDRLMAGRTVVIIAHRLSTIKNAGRIVVLRDGELVQQGSYDQLARSAGYFSELLAAQAPLATVTES